MRHMLAILFIPNGPAIFGVSNLIVILGAIILIAVVALIIGLVVLRNGGKSKHPAGPGATMPDWQRQGQTADNAWGQPQQQQPGGWGAQGVPQQQPGAWGAQGVPQQQQADPWGQSHPYPSHPQQQSQPAWGSPSAESASSQPASTFHGGGQAWGQTAQPADPWATPSPQQPQPAQQGGWPQSFQQATPLSGDATIPGSDNWGAPIGTPVAPVFDDRTAVESATVREDSSATVAATLVTSLENPARFIIRDDKGDVLQEYRLEKSETVIGRAPASDILLSKDKLTSRRHAVVRYENGDYVLSDERSVNGTFVNGQQLEELVSRVLKDGDHVGIGEHELIFRTSSGVEDLPTISVPSDAVGATVAKEVTYRTREDEQMTAAGSKDFSTRSMDTSSQERIKVLSLFAIARTTLEQDDRACVGKVYSVEAGISQLKPAGFAGEPFDLPLRSYIRFLFVDILLHASSNIELISHWQRRLRYDSDSLQPQLVAFKFRVVAPQRSSLAIDFYYERRWLRTIHFEFDAVEQSQLTAISSGG